MTKKLKEEVQFQYFFDIETSRVPVDQEGEEDIQVVYLTNVICFDLVNGGIVSSVFHRTLAEVINYFHNESLDKKINVYVHNLDYELTFLLKETLANGEIDEKMKKDNYGLLLEQSVFRDKNAPLKVVLDVLPNVTFKDSYALFNKTVSMLGNDLIKRGMNFPKLDYNYEKIRLPWSKLEELDYQYNQRDNEIVAYSLYNWVNDNNCKLDNIPLTFTSATKRRRYNFIMDSVGEREEKERKNRGNKIISSLNIERINSVNEFDFYYLSTLVYQGGLTTCVPKYLGKQLKNVYSIDLKSDYPSQMVRRYFPIFNKDTTYKLQENEAIEFYHTFLHNKDLSKRNCGTQIKGYLGCFLIEDIEIKSEDYFLPLSSNKCNRLVDEVKVNGKIKSAKRLILYANDVDLLWINKSYRYKKITPIILYLTTKSRRLSSHELNFTLHNFFIKETIDKKHNPIEYGISKININSMYGIKVQKPIKDRFSIINGEIQKIDFDNVNELNMSKEEIYNNYMSEKNKNRFTKDFDVFTDGIYITSYARLELIEMQIKLIENKLYPIYTDTDSIKFMSKVVNKKVNNKVHNLIEEHNEMVIEENRNNPRVIDFFKKYNIQPNIQEKILKLGIWECESLDEKGNYKPYPFFKTLGAKKYCFIDHDGIHTTIAGCSTSVSKDIEKYCEVNKISYDKGLNFIFDLGTKFNEEIVNKLTPKRERRTQRECVQLTYQGIPLNSYGGIILEPTSYTLNLSAEDCDLLDVERYEEPVRELFKDGLLKIYDYEYEMEE